MKYGESFFDIAYLLFALICGCLLLKDFGRKENRLMGSAALILGLGDAFHLVPRVLNYFVDADFTAWLGIDKLVTSITMTVFYVFMVWICREHYQEEGDRKTAAAVGIFTLLRVAACLFPQNGWLTNSSDVTWGIIRNVPFVILGAIVCLLYFRRRNRDRVFRFVWLYILLSFAFYIPVAVAAGLVPMLGMLMLPKTICYILILCAFLRARRT